MLVANLEPIAAHDAIRDIREAHEDELEPKFDEQEAQLDTEHPEENIYEDDYEDYDDEFGKCVTLILADFRANILL